MPNRVLLNARSRAAPISRRIQSQSPESEMDNYASFISEALEKTKCRECVPSWEEIQMLMNRQEMLCTVHYPGPGSCQLYISSHTTATEVCLPSSKVLAKLPSFSQWDSSMTTSLLKRVWLLCVVCNCERMCLLLSCVPRAPPHPSPPPPTRWSAGYRRSSACRRAATRLHCTSRTRCGSSLWQAAL